MSEYEIKKAHHSYKEKEALIKRLNRIEGQIRGLGKMVDQDVYCDNILHQFKSVESALGGVKLSLLEMHLKSCVVEQIQSGELEVVDELLKTIKQMSS